MAKEPAKKEEKKGARSLYDNPRSEPDTVAPAAEPAAGGEMEAAEDRGISQAIDGVTIAVKGLKALHEAHKRERDDFHGGVAQSMTDMAKRHEEQFQNLMKELGAGPDEPKKEA